MIKYIQAYEVDGKTFATMEAAEAYEARKNLDKLLESGGVGRGGEWDTDMFRDWILGEGQRLIELLRLIERGGYG